MHDNHLIGKLVNRSDSRILELGEWLLRLSANFNRVGEFSQNSWLQQAAEQYKPTGLDPMAFGFIRKAIPYANWYQVQLEAGQGFIYCCAAGHTGFNPIGVRPTSPLPPGTRVMVMRHANRPFGTIMCTLPEISPQIASAYMPDKVQYGSGSGFLPEAIHTAFQKFLSREGQVLDFSSGRPMDATAVGEYGMLAETGVGLFIDSYQAYLRVDEICGLFLNYFDHHMRLAGWNMDWQTAAHELQVRDDEGELQLFEGEAIFPWEALGALQQGVPSLEATEDDQTVQYTGIRSKIEPINDDVQPFYRVRRFGGYLGQGGKRMVVLPPPSVTVNRASGRQSESSHEQGVFEETVGLDGSFSLRSAHSLVLAKKLLIPVPKRIRLAEDQQEGSDNASNYRASGATGEGPPHVVGNLPIISPMSSAARALDFQAYAFNWKGEHPFYYHQGDFDLPDESDLVWKNSSFSEFAELADQQYMSLPASHSVRVDDRYGEQAYFESESYVHMLPEGGVVIGDGYGAEIRMTGGTISITAPGDIQIMPGRNLVQFAGDDAVLRAKNSIDISASLHDLRLKAEKNLQVVGKGLLFESKGAGSEQDFENKIGESVDTSGILFKAAAAPFVVWTQGIYARTNTSGGNIVLDASKGAGDLITNSRNIHNFVAVARREMFGTEGRITNVNTFAASQTIIDTTMTVKGSMFVVGGSGMLLEGNLSLPTGVISSIQSAVGQLKGDSLQKAREVVSRINETISDEADTGNELWKFLDENYYQRDQLGDSRLQTQAGFSFRDAEDQYGTGGVFTIPESRWQRMAREGEGSSPATWQENPVLYQQQDLYPYPGAYGYRSAGFATMPSTGLRESGRSADRPEPYVDITTPPEWQVSSLNQYPTVR